MQRVWYFRRKNFWFIQGGGITAGRPYLREISLFSLKLSLKSKNSHERKRLRIKFYIHVASFRIFFFIGFFFILKRVEVLVAIFIFNVPAATMNAPCIRWFRNQLLKLVLQFFVCQFILTCLKIHNCSQCRLVALDIIPHYFYYCKLQIDKHYEDLSKY